MINLYRILLITNLIYIIKYFNKPNLYNKYLRQINDDYIYHSNYEDEFNKVKNKIISDTYQMLSKSDKDIFEHEFQINCFPFLDNTLCDEYMQIKYNMTLNEHENQIIEYMCYYFNNIKVIKKNNSDCCNTYQLYW